jgi:phosphoribosyl 1,2-cyclic phosphodiesterase
MLRCGPYPFHLQQRILSDYGHLSNEAASEAALKLVKSGTEHIMLGHLSEHNNLPEIAMLETTQALTNAGIQIGNDVTLQIAHRHNITVMED